MGLTLRARVSRGFRTLRPSFPPLLFSVVILLASAQVNAAPGDLLLTIDNPEPEELDRFGVSVDGVGTNILIGAWWDKFGALQSGSAYLYDGDPRSATFGELLLTLRNPTPAENDFFGFDVMGVGPNLLIGAYGDNSDAESAGIAYLYDGDRTSPTFGELLHTFHNPEPEANDFFGFTVDATGTMIAIGAYRDNTGAAEAGSVYIFDGDPAGPTFGQLLTTLRNPTPAPTDWFGRVMTHLDGDFVVAATNDDTTAEDAGSVYRFEGDRSSAGFGQLVVTLNNPDASPGDRIGVCLTSSGNTLVAGSLFDSKVVNVGGAALAFDATTGELSYTVRKAGLNEPGDQFGHACASLGSFFVVDAHHDNTGADQTGSVYVYRAADGAHWLTIHNPEPEDLDLFGWALGGMENGNIIVGTWANNTGADSAGTVYLYEGFSPDNFTREWTRYR